MFHLQNKSSTGLYIYIKSMTEAPPVLSPSVPLTTVENVFSITYGLFDTYRTSIAIFTGTGIIFY